MVTKCLEHLNCPSELGLYLEAKIPTTIHLKKLIACQFLDEKIPHKLTLNITLTTQANITIIDDLCTQENDSCSCSWINNLNFILHRQSKLTYRMQTLPTHQITSSTLVIEKNLVFTFIEPEAHATAFCSCKPTGNTTITFNTLQDHRCTNTASTLIIKGALSNQSKMTSENIIHIHPNCKNVSAQQSTKVLFLGTECHAQAKPQLKIETDNVHCKHEAILSRLNKDHLFYLQSRGLNLVKAQTTFINGFLED